MNLITWNNYFTVGLVMCLAHLLFVIVRGLDIGASRPIAMIKLILMTLFLWPLLPVIWLAVRTGLRNRKEHRNKALVLAMQARSVFEDRPYMIISIDTDEDNNLHLYTNLNSEGQIKIIETAKDAITRDNPLTVERYKGNS